MLEAQWHRISFCKQQIENESKTQLELQQIPKQISPLTFSIIWLLTEVFRILFQRRKQMTPETYPFDTVIVLD